MLGNAEKRKQLKKQKVVSSKLKSKLFFKIIFSLLPSTLAFVPRIAAAEVLGIVKSQENAPQWSEISDRLQQAGIKYCIVDAYDWNEELDFGNAGVLLLPNVGKINQAQIQSLEQWMDRGGKTIVTGPTGNLSPSPIRSQLRKLLGAYWGYSLSSASAIELSDNTPIDWQNEIQLSQTLTGGALIPTTPDSQAAAFWKERKTAAAVLTDNSTFLGWRWGSDRVAPANLDAQWLTAALNRYGINAHSEFSPVADFQPTTCNPKTVAQSQSQPLLSTGELPLTSRLRPFRFQSEPVLSAREIEDMTLELKGLIGRFETTLFTAEANYNDVELSTSQVIQQLLTRQTIGNKQNSKQHLDSSYAYAGHQNARQALTKAKAGLNRFLYLVDQRSYIQAKQAWSQAKKILWENYPTGRPVAQSEVRAMWLDRGTIVEAESEADLVEVFDRMATAGINTVFFETLNSGYTIYPSKVAPQQNPLVKGWDPLKAAVKLAHERGIELHAWVWTFAAVNKRHNIIVNKPRHYLGPVLSQNPDWALTDQGGSRFHYSSGKVFFDPANAGVRNYLAEILTEIATEYEVDGIHLDYIRYPFQNPTGKITYGYGYAARKQFQQMTGVDPIKLDTKHPLWSKWTKFRIEQVDSFVASVSQQLKQLRPDLILSTAVFPIERRERLSKIQQHWEEWVKNEWIDMLVPMTYVTNTEKLNQLTSPLFRESSQGKALLLPGIRLLHISDVVALDQMQLLRGMSTEGYALFAAENLDSDFESTFSRTQGSLEVDNQEPLPYRQPFAATLSRYQSLQKEWNFFLSNHQLAVEEPTLREWGNSADRLAVDLAKLADNPSSRNLFSTQLALSSLRRKFPYWMAQTNSITPHQAKVWQDRLNALDRLLNYGEKRVLNQERQTAAN